MASVLSATVFSASGVAEDSLDAKYNSVAEIFDSEGITATFVVASVFEKSSFIYNMPRSRARFSPASTFKIPNTLIALDLGIVVSSSSPFEWDGTDRGLDRWNRNQTLETAFKVSCVWCYQEIARTVGAKQYESVLAVLDYGNHSAGSQVDRFWLDGSLRISAVEQVAFLRKLFNEELWFQRAHIDILKKIMITQRTEQYTIYAKTGWAATNPQVAWYVGFVESGNEMWLFAMNMLVESAEQASLREELAKRSLRALKII